MRISDWSSDVCSSDLGMGAEDFAYFVQPELGVPGAYFAVGGTPQADIDAAKNGGPPVPSHHSPFFKIVPEPSVRLGTEERSEGHSLGNEVVNTCRSRWWPHHQNKK